MSSMPTPGTIDRGQSRRDSPARSEDQNGNRTGRADTPPRVPKADPTTLFVCQDLLISCPAAPTVTHRTPTTHSLFSSPFLGFPAMGLAIGLVLSQRVRGKLVSWRYRF
eukprot:7112402-Prymnesium_polylepis.2